MVRYALIAVLVICACKREKYGGIQATLRFASSTPARCARVYATGQNNQVQRHSGPVLNQGRDALVGVNQSELLGQTITLEAHGYDNEACSGPWIDDSNIVSADFVGGQVTTDVLLVLDGRPELQPDAGVELCDDGVDDDGDLLADCQDPDCDNRSCGAPNYCSNFVCRRPMTELNCVDGADDDMDGAIDCADSDCAGRSCSDGSACTASDQCVASACTGTAVVCNAPTECQEPGSGTCVAGDGGCSYTPRTGACGDGGSCVQGDCMLQLPYAPANIPRALPFPDVAGPLSLDCGDTTFNTDTLTWSNPCPAQPALKTLIVPQGSGVPALVLLATRSLDIASGSALLLQGSRPFALAVFGDATVAGRIDASADHQTPGGGAPPDCGSGDGDPADTDTNAGGGGAAHSGDGAFGGDENNTSTTGGIAGRAISDSDLEPLRGGCSGGAGGFKGAGPAAPGGAGGGAFQLSVAGTLTVAGGTLTAAGGGGRGGTATRGGGGGGGSGGGILLEATTVRLTGQARVLALGGGGGGGAQESTPGGDGQNGHLSDDMAATGGTRGGDEAGNGGQGEAPSTSAVPGSDGDARSGNEGGGGGGGASMGRIVVHGNCSKGSNVETAPRVCP